MNCQECQQLLVAQIYGEVDENSAGIAEHCRQCASCAAWREDISAGRQLLNCLSQDDGETAGTSNADRPATAMVLPLLLQAEQQRKRRWRRAAVAVACLFGLAWVCQLVQLRVVFDNSSVQLHWGSASAQLVASSVTPPDKPATSPPEVTRADVSQLTAELQRLRSELLDMQVVQSDQTTAVASQSALLADYKTRLDVNEQLITLAGRQSLEVSQQLASLQGRTEAVMLRERTRWQHELGELRELGDARWRLLVHRLDYEFPERFSMVSAKPPTTP